MSSLFDFNEVKAKTATPASINQIVSKVLGEDHGACYSEIEPQLMPPGRSGSRSFDQAYAVDILLRHDALQNGQLAVIMETTGMSRRILWDRLYSVLRQSGFKMSHGRIVGILEDHSKKNGEDVQGQPDVD